jgi:hypothetical protein
VTAQVLAAVVAAVYGFVATLVPVKSLAVVWGFGVSAATEADGLDVSEHGDLGGPVIEEVAETKVPEPRAAGVPPDGRERSMSGGWRRNEWVAVRGSRPVSSPTNRHPPVYPQGPGTKARPLVRQKLTCEAPPGAADPVAALVRRVVCPYPGGG